MKVVRWALIVAICDSLLTACSGVGSPARNIASQNAQNVGCKNAQSEMWTSLYRIAERGAAFPSGAELRQALTAALHSRGLSNTGSYVDAFVDNYNLTIDGIRSRFAPNDPAAWKKALAEMEVGVRITSDHFELQNQLQDSLARLRSEDVRLNADCQNGGDGGGSAGGGDSGKSETVWDQFKSTPEVYGLRKVMAVAYQSCDVVGAAPMTAATPSVQGIVDLGDRGDGGHTRKIGDLAKLVATDYYIAGRTTAGSSCFSVKSDPLIYNFGGKPYTTSSNENILDLFTHVTTGGPTLGIDCSGFVFSALAVAGLKLDPDPSKVMKADLVWGVGSEAFKEPEANGLRCLRKISVDAGTSILPGDIVAINGHVFMIDSIGSDPFGVNRVKSLSDCASLSSANFDFVIAQSAPVKNGIGINRIRAADYMPESSTIRNGLLAYAEAACRARLGGDPSVNSPNLSVVRHRKTPECLAPRPLTMAHEDCIEQCKP